MKRFLLAALLLAGVICATGTSLFLVLPKAAAAELSLSSGSIFIRMHGDRLSLDVRDADIDQVLGEIAAQAGISITAGNGIAGRVNLHLTEATVTEALKALCQSQALIYEYLPEKNAYRVIRALALSATAEIGRAGTPAVPNDGFAVKQSVVAARGPGNAASPAPSDPANSPRGLGTPPTVSEPGEGSPTRPAYAPHELLVKFKEDVPTEAVDALHRSLGGTVLRNIPKLRLQRIKLKEGLPEENAMALYTASEIVAHAEKHALRYPHRLPNDPAFPRQWALTKLKAPAAWEITQGSREVVVAVIDSGVDYTHPDLVENIWINTAELNGKPGVDDDGNGYIDDIRGWDFMGNYTYAPSGDNNPMDVYGHGTHVAGIVAARGNNGLGIAGVNWKIRIMALKVEADNGNAFEDFAIIEAIQYAIANGARVIVCSFGGSARGTAMEAAFTDLQNAGILAACAAGNSGLDSDIHGNENYPSDYPLDHIISVAASDRNDNLAAFSNYGATSVDLMAPGVDIYSAVPVGTDTEAHVRTGGALPVQVPALGMEFSGTTDGNGITGALYNCGQGYPDQFPAGVTGYIALIQRGSRSSVGFTFADKVRNAQTAGTAGVIVYNNTVDVFDTGGGTLGAAGSWAPVVSITKAAGETLIQSAVQEATLINTPAAYGVKNGTSMAAPHVAGAAGLILAHCPSLGVEAVKAALVATVDKIPAVSDRMVSGGRLNAFTALQAILPQGDLSGDCRVGIEDAVLALQLLAGLPTGSAYPCPACGGDLDGDAQIGLPETLFILQKTAELR